MARLRYGRTAAEFAVDLGPVVDILDDNGDPTGEQGRTAALPLVGRALSVYTAPEPGALTEDLLSETGDPITEIVSGTELSDLATYPEFQGPDGHVGPLFLSADGQVFYRAEPDSAELYGRVGALEGASYATTDLEDVASSTAGRTDGAVLAWSEDESVYVPTPPSSFVSGVATVNGQDGDVTLSASDVGAAPTGHVHSGADIVDGVLDVTRLPVGGNAWQVAAGNHTHSISGVTGLRDELDARVVAAEVARVWPVIGADDPTPPEAVDGDIIVRRVQ